jgi:Protein of unknwon function (DUF3310)
MKYEEVMSVQYGGSHYKNHKIQPWEIWAAYEMDGWEASATKYLLRYKYKGKPLEDLYKLKHNVEYLIAREERKQNVQDQANQGKSAKVIESIVQNLRPSSVGTAETSAQPSRTPWRGASDYDNDAPLGI